MSGVARARGLVVVAVSAAFGIGLLAVPSCAGGGDALLVDLRTDLAAGRVFTIVQTVVTSHPDGSRLHREEVPVRTTDDYLAGRRIAEVSGIDAAEVLVEVSLLGPDGDIVKSRRALVHLADRTGVTVVISAGCIESCPRPGDPPDATECLGSRCVTPECVAGTDPACSAPECTADSSCTVAACAMGLCAEGVCLGAPLPGVCSASEVCDPARGCVLVGGCECDAGEIETDETPCGNCGLGRSTRQRECAADCTWGAWGEWTSCDGGGECPAGTTERFMRECIRGSAGTRSCSRTCQDDCTWAPVMCQPCN